MEISYKYTDSKDFIDNLDFESIETYSLQRGIEFETENERQENEYEKLQNIRESKIKLTIEENKQYLELDKLLGFTQYLINDEGKLHYSSKKLNTFNKGDERIDELKNILRTQVKEIPMLMCAPTYRDAFIFLDGKGKFVTSLNVCLGCYIMETRIFDHINADFETYDLLKKFFVGIGHDVEDPNVFLMEEFRRKK